MFIIRKDKKMNNQKNILVKEKEIMSGSNNNLYSSMKMINSKDLSNEINKNININLNKKSLSKKKNNKKNNKKRNKKKSKSKSNKNNKIDIFTTIKEDNNNENKIEEKDFNSLPYSRALEIDKRNIFLIYLSFLKLKINIIQLLFYPEEFTHLSLTLSIYFLDFLFGFFMNAFLYTDDFISEKYHNNDTLNLYTIYDEI